MMTPNFPTSILAAGAATLLLAGCDASEAEPRAAEESATSAAPSGPPVVEEPATSIIRPEVAPDTIVDLPPEPLTLTIGFPEGRDLSEAAQSQLASLLESAAVAEGWPIVLRGHSDSAGGDAANLRASRRRAEVVATWLTERGVSEDRIRIIPMGEQNPVAPNAKADGSPNEAGRARNRRVEVIVSPNGAATNNDAENATAAEGVAGQDTAVEQAIQGLSGADTP